MSAGASKKPQIPSLQIIKSKAKDTVGVLGQACIQHGIGDLIAELIRVALIHGLRGEQKVTFLGRTDVSHFGFVLVRTESKFLVVFWWYF